MITTGVSGQNGQYANVNGIKMYYEIHGSGSPLVLIHGGGSTLHTTFGRMIPLLSKTYKVIGVELQAHGHTSDRNAPESFTQDADDVAQLLKQLNIANSDIFGFSNGGNTAMQLAIRHPERVRKLVLASSFYKKEGMAAGFWDFMKNAKFEHMPQIYKDEYLKINPGNLKGLHAMHDKDAARMQAFTDWTDETLKSVKVPVLVMSGDKDVVLPEHSVAMSQLFPNGRLAIITGDHGSYIGEIMSKADSKTPVLVAAMIGEFLAAPMP